MVFLARFVFLVTFLLGYSLAAPGKLPSTFKKCQKKDPELMKCLSIATEDTVKQMSRGISSLAIPPIDPFFINQLDIGNKDGKSVKIDLILSDVIVKGISTVSDVKYLKADIDNKKFKITGKMKQPLTLDGNYKVSGQLLILPITGQGKFSLKLDDFIATVTMNGKERIADGKAYMDIEKFKFEFDTSRLYLHFENLLGGNKALGDNLNLVINENWKEILEDLKPGIEDAFSQTLEIVAQRVFKVPYKEIFP